LIVLAHSNNKFGGFGLFGVPMIVTDFDGAASVRSQKELERRLTFIREGEYGSFILTYRKGGPSLWIHVRKVVAYLHYFPHPDYLIHAGYQATGMTPPRCKRPVRFRLIGGENITMPPATLVPFSDAVAAAKEFFKHPGLPPSISWLEL
jgi:hypothetical protein